VLAPHTAVSADGTSVTLSLLPPAGGWSGADVVGVRYCWQGFPLCVLRNGNAGLPAMPFVANITAAL
jgi:hypothetical protein